MVLRTPFGSFRSPYCCAIASRQYLMECVTQVFPTEFHVPTLAVWLQHTGWLAAGADVKALLVGMMQRLQSAPAGEAAEEEARRWRGAREMASPFDAAAALRDRCALGAGAALLCVLALRRGCARGRTRVGKVECKQRHE